jgi:peptidyl-prolyl cis-trans isomerase D
LVKHKQILLASWCWALTNWWSSAQQGGDLDILDQIKWLNHSTILYLIIQLEKIGLVETEYGFHIITVTDKQELN